MFSTQVIEHSTKLLWDTWKPGFLPHESSIAEADDLMRRLAKAVDEKGNPTREISQEEHALIVNERLLCKANFKYWAERYAFISKGAATVERMYPLLATQEFILDRIAEVELKTFEGASNDGVLINLLKGARQIGGSTLAEVIAAYKFTQQSHLHGLIAADEPKTSAHLFDMFERVVAKLPWWLKPQVTEHVKDSEMLFDTESHIWMGSGKSTRGTEGQRGQLGRGKTLSYVHLSEVSTWEGAEQIDSALFFAIPRTSRVFVMLESTAKGRHNWWHTHWETSKKGGMTPAGTFECVFIPWYAARDLSKYSVVAPAGWTPSEHTQKIAKITEETSPRWMKRRVILTREQLYWYEATRAYYESKDDLGTFLEEVGSADDDETFQHSGRSVFGNAIIQKIRESARPLAAMLEVGPWADLKPGPAPLEAN
jgi:hypothetical protein